MEFLELKEIFFEVFGKYVVKICILRMILFIFHKLAVVFKCLKCFCNRNVKRKSNYLTFYILSYYYYHY